MLFGYPIEVDFFELLPWYLNLMTASVAAAFSAFAYYLVFLKQHPNDC